MPSAQVLDISNVINITLQPTPVGLANENINTLALFSKETPSGWAVGQTFAIYTNASQVGVDFGANSNAFAIAQEVFAQQPNPLTTNGYLVIIPRLQSPSLETTQAAITRTLNSVFYFGILIDEEVALSGFTSTVFASLATYVQGLDKMFFYCSSAKADFAPGGLLDLVRQATEYRTRGLYYGNPILNGAAAQQTQMFAGAYASRLLSTDFTGSLTTITMHLKQLAGPTPDQTMTQTDLNAAQLAGVDVYVNIASFPALFTSGANEFADQVYNRSWLKNALQVAGFNYLATVSTKIPQTEPGMEGLKQAYRLVLEQAKTNGYAAPGSWTSPNVFGNPADLIRSVGDIGYYVFSQPVAKQSPADRAARKAPLVQIAIKEAGAIHESNVLVNVNV